MATPTRLPNKAIWGLEDVIAITLRMRQHWRRAHEVAERSMDPVLLASLGHLSDDLAAIDTLVRDLRAGKYNGQT